MKFANIFIFICILSIFNSCQKNKKELDNNISNENNFEKYIPYSKLLTKDYHYNYIPIPTSKEEEYRSSSKDLLFNALKQYQDNDIYSALEYIESAIKMYPEGIYYYHYGVFLMDINDYINAEKAFNIAINFIFPQEYFQEKRDIFTFDNNGLPREKYFAFYNLACIYSINMDLKKSLEYLIYSIEQGYPYIDNIFSDVDLSNLLKSDDNIETFIKNKYQNGFKNIFTGKIFKKDCGFYHLGYYFVDDKNVKKYSPMSEIREHRFYGTYEIKNYNIYIHFNKETGQRGVIGSELGAASVMVYAKYEDYSNDIDENEIISMADMVSGEEWEEVNRYYDFYAK